MEERIVSFPPVAAENARLLILGTMPSVESLKQNFYYSHPRNAFWRILTEVLGESCMGTPDEKTAILIKRKIALWDVAQSCVRPGSLDSDIRDVLPNDLPGLFARCPHIEKILFNGAAAQNLYKKHIGAVPDGCVWERMPSTSPAYTLGYARKLEAWRAGMEGYYD